ncbi:MAG TPA: hypothetical protein VKU87_12010, partial [Thermomicrobiaceae bacterium]|nr:hypothetical protein [Thermomicrobiaceae bacterium]
PHGTVRATNLATRKVVTISSEQGGASPAISGDWVIWMGYTGSGRSLHGQLFARNLADLAPARQLAPSPLGFDAWPLISGERVVWVEIEQPGMVLNGPQTQRWRLRELSLDDPTPVVIAEGSETSHCTSAGGDVVGCALQSGSLIGGVSLNGSTLSYIETTFDGRRRSVVRDLDTGRITIIGGDAVDLISDGRYAFWSGAAEQPSRIHAFDLITGRALTLVEDAGLNLSSSSAFSIGGGWLVWERAPAGVFKSEPNIEELHAARIDDLMAAAASAHSEPEPVSPVQKR